MFRNNLYTMELLKEIVDIIHRYLFESDYSRVRKQYNDVWLNDKQSCEQHGVQLPMKVFWCESTLTFRTIISYVANYRVLKSYSRNYLIVNFKRGGIAVDVIPPKY